LATLWFGAIARATVWIVVAALTCGVPRALAQTLQTILTNGPTSNRLNVVVLSEGYTSTQLAQFSVDATNAVNALLSHPPYQEYRAYFNAYAIKVASNASGSDHPAWPSYRDTYFNSSYDRVSDRLITIPAGSTGQGRVDALLKTFMPKCQLPVLLVNDFTPGGSDGFDDTAIASIGYELSEILTHETGHVLANLGDEYTDAYPGFPDTEEPNTTQQTNRLLIKWKAWISTNTPIPTPTTVGNGVVGLFVGAHYHTTNWYRPQLNCVMGSPGAPFCPVCSEALVLAIYQRVRPVDSVSPANTNFSVTTTQALAFSLALLQPATHNLEVQWFTNGVPWSGASNSSFTLLPQSFPNGTNWVSAVVRDHTSLVRYDPTNLLGQTVRWAVNVSLPQLRLDSPLWLTGGRFVFRVAGYAPQGVVVQSSTNLSTWVPLATNSLVGGQFWYTNPATGSFPRRFYRAVTPP
jgi:IgA Peptidase M64